MNYCICENKHIYDSDKHNCCPVCKSSRVMNNAKPEDFKLKDKKIFDNKDIEEDKDKTQYIPKDNIQGKINNVVTEDHDGFNYDLFKKISSQPLDDKTVVLPKMNSVNAGTDIRKRMKDTETVKYEDFNSNSFSDIRSHSKKEIFLDKGTADHSDYTEVYDDENSASRVKRTIKKNKNKELDMKTILSIILAAIAIAFALAVAIIIVTDINNKSETKSTKTAASICCPIDNDVYGENSVNRIFF